MKHEFKQRIIYRDTDAEGVVYYANYLAFFERGRIEILRQAGISLPQIKDEYGVVFAVAKVECSYHSPAKYDDEVTVRTEISQITPARIFFKHDVWRGAEFLVSAIITICAIDIKMFKAARIPEKLVRKLT